MNRDGVGPADADAEAGVHIDWQWIPSWGREYGTHSGREQLRSIGFTI